MTTNEYVEFKKERDLGSIITDAFKFIRLEWKPFFKTIFSSAIIPIVIAVVGFIYYMSSFGNMTTVGNDSMNIVTMVVSILVAMIASLVALVFINLSGMYYIKSYIDNKGNVNQQEIKANTKQKFWSFTGFGVLAYLILIVSAMLCVFPVFYTITALSVGASILVFENESAGSTITKCFEFIKGHFWPTLGVIIVVMLLITIFSTIFQIPMMIYQMIKMTTIMGSDDPTQVAGLFKDPIYLALYSLSLVGQYFFYGLTLVTNVFLYFDINEQKNATGSFEKIDALGQ